MQQLHQHVDQISKDLSKVAKGNKAASQRVRTTTLHLEKVGKTFRKESLQLEKNGKFSSIKKTAKRKAKSLFSRKRFFGGKRAKKKV